MSARPRSDRHIRQERLPQVGAAGQAALAAARVVIVGVGATGSHLAQTLGRAGVGNAEAGGWLRLLDRDVVELSNLQRQVLFTTADVEAVRPKAQAAATALLAIDPGLAVEAVVADLTADNAPVLLGGATLVLDGTDNFPTRFLVNDWCVQQQVPFVYCGVVGTEGQVLLVRPGGPCLRCYVPELPAPGSLPTCDTAGVLGSAVSLVTSLAATTALRVLLGAPAAAAADVLVADAWEGELRRLRLPREPDCPCCVRGEHPFLLEAPAASATELCGRDAVQLPATGAPVDLPAIAAQLRGEGAVTLSPFLVRLDMPAPAGPGAAGRRILVFRDGRVIVGGTRDPAEARGVRARLLGE